MTDEEQMYETLAAKAANGDVEATYELGWRSALGMGLRQDDALGLEWLRKAALGGHMLAQNNLGARYVSGDGVTVNLVEAYRWFHLAAEQGDRKAGKNRESIAAQLSPEELAIAQSGL